MFSCRHMMYVDEKLNIDPYYGRNLAQREPACSILSTPTAPGPLGQCPCHRNHQAWRPACHAWLQRGGRGE